MKPFLNQLKVHGKLICCTKFSLIPSFALQRYFLSSSINFAFCQRVSEFKKLNYGFYFLFYCFYVIFQSLKTCCQYSIFGSNWFTCFCKVFRILISPSFSLWKQSVWVLYLLQVWQNMSSVSFVTSIKYISKRPSSDIFQCTWSFLHVMKIWNSTTFQRFTAFPNRYANITVNY